MTDPFDSNRTLKAWRNVRPAPSVPSVEQLVDIFAQLPEIKEELAKMDHGESK